jgi:Tol biopolymer transport system component
MPDNSIVYTKNYDTGLYRMSFDGRDSSVIVTPDRKKGELGDWWPQVLPDGEHVLFTNYTTPADHSRIEAVSLKTRERKVVLDGAYYGRYVDGHLMFVRNGSVMSIRMDPSSLKVTGTETEALNDVQITPQNGWAAFEVAQNGTVVSLTDAAKSQELTWTSQNGDEENAVDSAGRYTNAVTSPDGKRIAVVKEGDVWVIDRGRKLSVRLTRTLQPEVYLVWTPDSRWILYARDNPQYDIYGQLADGSGTEKVFVTSANDKEPMSVTPDGRTLLYGESSAEGDDIFETSLTAPKQVERRLVVGGNGSQHLARLSPDGRWIVYLSSESGRDETYVAPYPANQGPARQQVSDGGSEFSNWARDGRTIYYSQGGEIRSVSFNPATGDIGSPQPLKRVRSAQGWNVAPDGRFLTRRASPEGERHSVKILFNWLQTLDAKN